MEGKITRWLVKKGFGFVQPDGGGEEVFIHRSAMTDGQTPGEGDKVSFEVEPGPKGPRAKDARIIERNPNPLPPRAPARAAPTPPPAPPPPQELAVGIKAKGYSIVEQKMGRKTKARISLPVWVEVSCGNNPVVSREVTLDADGQPVVQFVEKVCTGKNGLAFFRVNLPADKTSCVLVAHVAGKDYSAYWDKESQDAEAQKIQALPTKEVTPPSPEPPKIATTIKVLETGTDSEGFTTFDVLTLTEDANGEGVAADYTVISSAALEAKEDDGAVETGQRFEYKTDDQGQDIAPVRPSKSGEATLYFRLTKVPTKMQGPFKVRRKEEAKPVEPPKTEPKVCGYIELQPMGTDGTWAKFRIMTLTSNKADAEGVPEVEVLIESIREMEVQDEAGKDNKGTSIPVTTDEQAFAVRRIKFTSPRKGEVAFRLKANPRVQAKTEVETKAPEPQPVPPVVAPKVERLSVSPDGIYTFKITGAAKANVKTEGVAPVELRKAPCPNDEAWTKDELTSDGDIQLVQLRVTEERARGMIHFCVGETFKSDEFFVAHGLPPIRPKPETKKAEPKKPETTKPETATT